MRPIVFNKDNIKPKLEKLVQEFNTHIGYHRTYWRRSEDAYRSNFYRKYVNEILNNKRLELTNQFREWLVEAEMNHSFSFVRLLHSTLISNEPVVTASPANNSQESRDTATAADSLIRYAKEKYGVKEAVDNFILRTFLYGMGCIRVDWNANLGEIVQYDKTKEELLFTGDSQLRVIEPYCYYLYSTSNNLMDVYGYMEKLYYDKEEAQAMWPEFADIMQTADDVYNNYPTNSDKNSARRFADKVIVWEYIEKSRPLNANRGRHILFLNDYTVLVLEDNPHEHKQLPIVLLPDIITPNKLFPVSIMEMLNSPQRQINELFSRVLENVKLYTKIFMLVDRNANLTDNALNDLPTIPITYTGTEGRPPIAMTPPQMPTFVFQTYDYMVQMMQHIAGVRDFSRGVMAKAVSGFAANLMVESDTKVHIQLHERYKEAVKGIYELLLSDIKQYWNEKRTISILNEEDEMETKAFMGADLNNGYVVKTDFGSTLPLDPAARRQMVQEIGTMAQQWGIKMDGNKFFELLRLGDVMGTFNISESAAKVQRKEKYIMLQTTKPVDIDYNADDHLAHYVELFGFFQTNEYANLQPGIKEILKAHAAQHLMADAFIKKGATEEQFKSGQLPQSAPQEGAPMATPDMTGQNGMQAPQGVPGPAQAAPTV